MPINQRQSETSGFHRFIPEFYLKIPHPLLGYSLCCFGLASRRTLFRRYAQAGEHGEVAPDKMERLPVGFCLLLDGIKYPVPDGLVVDNFLGLFRQF